MKTNMSFQERAKLAMEKLSKQQPVTLEQMRMQARWLKDKNAPKFKKDWVEKPLIQKEGTEF